MNNENPNYCDQANHYCERLASEVSTNAHAESAPQVSARNYSSTISTICSPLASPNRNTRVEEPTRMIAPAERIYANPRTVQRNNYSRARSVAPPRTRPLRNDRRNHQDVVHAAPVPERPRFDAQWSQQQFQSQRHRSQPAFQSRQTAAVPIHEQRNRHGHNLFYQNAVVMCEDSPDDVQNLTVNDPEQFMEDLQQIHFSEYRRQDCFQNNMMVDNSYVEQSTWIGDYPEILATESSPHQLVLDDQEPILASSFNSNNHSSQDVQPNVNMATMPKPRELILPPPVRKSGFPIPTQRTILPPLFPRDQIRSSATAQRPAGNRISQSTVLSSAPQPPRAQSVSRPLPSGAPSTNIGPGSPELVEIARRLSSITSSDIEKMSVEEAENHLTELWFSLVHIRYRYNYPFVASGVFKKDSLYPNKLNVYSSRMGKIDIPDQPSRKTADDFVYFIVLGPERYTAFSFSVHEDNMISTKFPSPNIIEIKVYAMMAHPVLKSGSRVPEGNWVCWSDQLGMMEVISGSARSAVKKSPDWDKQLDIVSVQARFENNRFIVRNIVALTNSVEKRNHFPTEVFLVLDATLKKINIDDYEFCSPSLDITLSVSKTLSGCVNVEPNKYYQIVVAPTFTRPTIHVFRALTIIVHDSFWKGKQWIKEELLKVTELYREDARCRNTIKSLVSS